MISVLVCLFGCYQQDEGQYTPNDKKGKRWQFGFVLFVYSVQFLEVGRGGLAVPFCVWLVIGGTLVEAVPIKYHVGVDTDKTDESYSH